MQLYWVFSIMFFLLCPVVYSDKTKTRWGNKSKMQILNFLYLLFACETLLVEISFYTGFTHDNCVQWRH